jgi:hypothetical protein
LGAQTAMDKVSEHSASYWDDVIEVLEEKVSVISWQIFKGFCQISISFD